MPNPRAPRPETHGFETIRIRLSFIEQGALKLEAYGEYGPLLVPILSREGEFDAKEEKGKQHEAERDLEVEAEARTFLAHAYPIIPTEEPHVFRVASEDIYAFTKDILPELEYQYTIKAEPGVLDRLTIRRLSITPDIGVRSSRQGWFDFSIAWHCEANDVDTKDILTAIKSGQPFVRTADGSFIEYENIEDVERIAQFLERAERHEDGSFSSHLFDAPEMKALIDRMQEARMASTDAAFAALLSEAEVGKPVEPVALPESLDAILRPYQKDGVAWMAFLHKYGFGGILADDMGLGKTLQVLAYIAATRKKGDKPDLVICPKTLTLTWMDEARKYVPDLKTLVIEGTADTRSQALSTTGDYDLVITTYPAVQRDIQGYLDHKGFRLCIIDEAQFIKNASTATAKAVKAVPAELHLALTGTPLENGVHELWSIYDYLMPGFLGDSKSFRVRYERPIKDKRDMQTLERLRTRIKPFMLRRTKAALLHDLPPKVEQVSHAVLTAEQLVVYGRTLDEVRAQVMKTVAEKGFEQSRIEILSALMKLRRICDHPHLVDPRLPATEEVSGKMELALELIRQAKEGGHKVLLFSQFTSMLDLIRDALDVHGIGHATIEGKTKDRESQVRQFTQNADTTVFLLSLRAGGTGLTLVEADTVILFDPWWNPMVESQAMDRAHRIGQKKTVNVYKLVTQGTVEEKVMELQERKKQLFDALVQETEADLQGLTWEEVKGLFE
ncbi:MAG: DEAD/DEAH box helicase [Patescibacteria group bacterium]